ncbi:MAG: S1 RNA-binding domain-containing protein [Mollicutes bacterium PWAP]|nr:S1 RNA-binding domain-containing protein [Mollicutes bacterium PWAP]
MKNKIILSGKVFSYKKLNIIVKLDDGTKGFLHVSKVSDYYVQDIKNILKPNFNYLFEVINLNTKERKLKELSYKSLNPRYLKNPFKYELESNKKDFESLKENTETILNEI